MLLTVLTGDLTFVSLKPCDLSNCSKNEIRAYFENSYNLNESIFVGLKDESVMFKCPDRLRLPLVFYYGHTASVYVNKLILAGLLQPEDRVNLKIETLCETGVDEMSWDDTENYRMGGKFQWPSLSEMADYRLKVRELVLGVIDKTPLQLPVTQESPWWAVMMGIEHERFHIETSSVLIRQLPECMVEVPAGWKTAPPAKGTGAGQNTLIPVSATSVTFGKPWDFPSYGWDNEYGEISYQVGAFEASKYCITNKEFLQFVLEGGYDNPSHWSDEGWKWVKFKQARHPAFWVCDKGCKSGCGADLATYSHCKCHQTDIQMQVHDNGHCGENGDGGLKTASFRKTAIFRLRCMYHVIDMPWDWPVEVNYLEAKAFCNWKGPGYRLLCEAEFNVIRGNEQSIAEGTICDLIFHDKIDANLNLQYGSSTPVNMFAANGLGFYDVCGNTWEWVEDHFNGLPGFKTNALYDDYSCPSFDGKHNMLLGGSWISNGDAASRFLRNAFRRHFLQHCGFRVARSVTENGKPAMLPVQIINKGVYVLNAGVDEICVTLDATKYSFRRSETVNQQYQYESEDALNEMLRLEYTADCTLSNAISRKIVSVVSQYKAKRQRALHLGAGTGYCTFTLASDFQEVLGQDFCARFIHACQELQNNRRITFSQMDGFKRMKCEITVPKCTNMDRITFKQLTWLPNEIGFFDFVLSTCFDRTMNPEAWIRRLPEVVNEEGLLVVVSAQNWTNNKLSHLFTKWFTLLEACNLMYNHSGKNKEVRVSVWRRKFKANSFTA